MSGLKEQVVNGIKWSIMAKLATQAFSWISTFTVIRILTPDDYGIMAIAMIFFSLISIFTTNGLIVALVRQQGDIDKSKNQIFTLSLLLNLLLSAVLAASASHIALWYDNQELTKVLWVMAAINPISSFMVVPKAALQINMRFKEKAIVESGAGLMAAAVAFGCALSGFGYWSLIFSDITLSLLTMIGLNWVAKERFKPTFSWHGTREIVGFALNVQFSQLIWFAYNKADTILIGRLLGVDKAGVYNVGSEIASIPMSKVNAIMGEVAFSAFAKTKDDISLAKGYLKKALRLMGVVVFPMFYGISAVADETINLLLGEKWSAAGPVVAILCIILPFRMLVSVMNNFCTGMGMARFGLQNGIVTACVLITAIAIGASYGLVQAAFAWVFGFSFVYMFLLFRFNRTFNLPLSTMLVFWPVFIISSCMLAGVNAVDYWAIPVDMPVWGRFLLKVATGALLAGPVILYLYGREIRDLLKRNG